MKRRILSLMLCVVMLFTMLPTGALATTVGGFQSEDSTEPTVAETTESYCVEPTTEETTVETTEGTQEETEPEETEETVPETTEETIPETTEETEPEETEPEETLFPGMPEDYALSASQKADKKDLSGKGCVSTLSGLTEGTDYVANQIMFWADSEEEAETIAEAYGAELVSYTLHIGVAELTDATVAEAVTAAADMDNNLPAVDPVYVMELKPLPDEPYYKGNQDLSPYAVETPEIQLWENFKDGDPFLSDPTSNTYQWYHDMVNTYEAWGVTQGAGVTVAVLDTGVDDTHPDLENVEIITGYGDMEGLFAYDLAGDHGTHVAGIIAATQGNGEGGAGVAPQANIMSINVFGDSDYFYGATYAMISTAIMVAAYNGADIINMSLGGTYTNYYSTVMQNALDVAYECGTSVFAAMGNEATNDMAMPACLDHVIAIAAVNRDGYLADFSSFGSWADLAAPGQDIMSSVPGGDYENWDGTSMATPVAAGVAALYIGGLGYNPGPDKVEAAMKKAVNKGYGSSQMGVGIVDASKLFASNTTKPMMGIFQQSLEDDTAILPQEQKDELFAGAVVSDGKYNAEIVIYDSYTLGIFPGNASANSQMLVYTVDGTNPAVKNGIVTNGTAVTVGGNGAGWGISLKKFPVGQKITVKAAFVSGMGVMSKISTLSFKITEDVEIEGMYIQGGQQIIAGKSATYTAVIEPMASANQKVTWKIIDKKDAPGAKITSKGVLSVKSSDNGGKITIQATSVDYPGVTATMDVEVIKVNPIKTIAINASKLTLGLAQGQEVNGQGYFQLEVSKLKDTKGNDVLELLGDGYDVAWTTSNPKVVTVDETGMVRATGLGTATVTCTAADGSKKSAKCTITVVTPPSEVVISGQSAIGRGKKATYTASVYPTAATKTVVWSVVGEAPAGVTLSSKGVLSVAKYAATGTVTIQATSVTGAAYATKTIEITDPTSYVRVVPVSSEQGVSFAYNASRNSLKTVNLYSADVPETQKNDQVFAVASVTTNNGPVTWSSNKTSVATVDANGVITAHKAGTATITCKADDGSGKKTTFTVKVTTPASYITLKSNLTTQVGFAYGELMAAEEYKHIFKDLDYVYMYTTVPGKSATNKVTLGDTYGKPSSAKVTWDFEMFQISYSTGKYADKTTWAKENKLVSVNSSGKLTVSKKMANYDLYNYDYVVIVYASIEYADHTVTGGLVYQVVDATTYVTWDDIYLEVYDEEKEETNLELIGAGKKLVLPATYIDEAIIATFKSDCLYVTNLSVTSSNPKVINLTDGVTYLEDLDEQGNVIGYVRCVEFVINGKGTSKITVTANDGSGKTATLTVTVK